MDPKCTLSKTRLSGRRLFLYQCTGLLGASLGLTACAVGTMSTEPSRARRQQQIETDFHATLVRCQVIAPACRPLVARARAVLLIPTVVTTNPLTGAQSGEGALRKGNVFVGYYLLTLEQGVQARSHGARSILLLFNSFDTVDQLVGSQPGAVLPIAPVAVPLGPNGQIDPDAPQPPLTALVFEGNALLASPVLTGLTLTHLEF